MSETKKELGQHWLKDPQVLRSIADAAQLTENDHVLEVGPGLGTLTKELARSSHHVTALEFDRDLIGELNARFANNDTVTIIEGDVRTFNFSSMPVGYKIVANIPYYLTSHLIRSISEAHNPPSIAVLLIQKEVAIRLCAKPGDMSILALTAQFYFECSLDIEVPARLFTPPPKVDSQVVVLKRRKIKLFDVEEADFFRFVKAGFSEKRKTLRNSLSGGLRMPKEVIEASLQSANIPQTMRAQQLRMEDWYSLYTSLHNVEASSSH